MSLRCENCGATYDLVGDNEEGYFRSLCECEGTHRCAKCKRGSYQPINQAELDLQYDVRRYLCRAHGGVEAADFPEMSDSVPKKKRTVVEVVEAKAPEPPPDPTKNPRAGMRIEEHAYLKTKEQKWGALKKEVAAARKNKENDFKVKCSTCQHEHWDSARKNVPDEEHKVIRILCPKCDGPSFTIL